MARCPNCGAEISMSTDEPQSSPNFQAVYQRMKFGVVTPQAQYYGNPDIPSERISYPSNLDRYTGAIQGGIYEPTTPAIPEIQQPAEGSNAMVITLANPNEMYDTRLQSGGLDPSEQGLLTTNEGQAWSKRQASGIKPLTNDVPVRDDSVIIF
jgi:hypothetical protein